MWTINEFQDSGAYRALNPRDKAVIDVLLNRAKIGEQATVDHIRRKLRTTAANVDEALVALSGAFEQVEYDADDKLAMWNILEEEAAEINDTNLENAIQAAHDAGAELTPADVGVTEEQMAEVEQDATDNSNIPVDENDTKSLFRFGGNQPNKYRALYKENGGHCGDLIGEYMTAHVNVVRLVPRKDGKGTKKVKLLDMDAVYSVARQNDISEIKGNNNGQVRMNLSNMLRKRYREGHDVHIGTAVVKGRSEAELQEQASEHDANTAAAEAEYAKEAARSSQGLSSVSTQPTLHTPDF